VVTTPEVAAVMGRANHFNTFGGSPLASAVGSAVLDVIEEDKLQEVSDNLSIIILTSSHTVTHSQSYSHPQSVIVNQSLLQSVILTVIFLLSHTHSHFRVSQFNSQLEALIQQ